MKPEPVLIQTKLMSWEEPREEKRLTFLLKDSHPHPHPHPHPRTMTPPLQSCLIASMASALSSIKHVSGIEQVLNVLLPPPPSNYASSWGQQVISVLAKVYSIFFFSPIPCGASLSCCGGALSKWQIDDLLSWILMSDGNYHCLNYRIYQTWMWVTIAI